MITQHSPNHQSPLLPRFSVQCLLMLSILLLTASSSLFGQSTDARLTAILVRADSLLDNLNLNAARTALEEGLTLAPSNFDLLWRASRVAILTGDVGAKDIQEAQYQRALEFANKAIEQNPNSSLGYLRRAAANGKLALYKGVLDASDYVKSVREDAQKAISLNNGGLIWQAAAHYILGRTHLKLTESPRVLRKPIGLDWGNLEEASFNLKRAIEFRPDFIMFRIDYARCMIKRKNFKEAREHLEMVATLEDKELGDDERRKEAISLLSEIEGK